MKWLLFISTIEEQIIMVIKRDKVEGLALQRTIYLVYHRQNVSDALKTPDIVMLNT